MKKYIVLLLLTISVASRAQNITGKVCYEKDKTPVQFASVALLNLPDSVMTTGVITLTDGSYTLEKIKPGNYFVRVSFVGYITRGRSVTIRESQKEVVVDTILLTETTASLKEITVVGERLKGKEMVDRTVYSIPEVVAKSSANGYDILKKIPQVNVDFQNNITLNGSSNFIIQVDGRQRDREYLARLLPSDIQTIEIISNPSGKYEGNIDGVINIILKKEARYGMNGNVAVALKPFNKVTGYTSGSLDYSTGKITFYATAFVFTQSLYINTTGNSQFPTIDSTTSSSGNGKIKVTMPSINSGFDYYIDDKDNLSFNISYKPINQDVSMNSSSILSLSGIPLNTVSSVTGNMLHSNETSLSLFYKRLFNKPVEELTAEVDYYMFKSDEDDSFSNEFHPYAGDSTISSYWLQQDNLNSRNYLMTKLDFVYPLGMNARIEAGYQFYYQKMGYNFNIDNDITDNMFEYDELRNSAYGGITFNLKKFGFQAMLRVENSHINADSVTQPNYSCYLPSANIQYKLSASQNLKLTYNRRINRPGIYDLNPYLKTSTNYTISQGNPDLKPDYRDRLQLTYTWNFGSNYFSPYVYDELFSNKPGTRYTIIESPIDHSLTTLSKPFNVLSGYELGGGLNAMLWYININARIYKGHYYAYDEPSFSIPSMDYFSYAITSYAYANLDKKKKTTAYIFLQLNGVNINAQSKTYSMPLYGIGAQRQFKNHNLGVFWLLPFSRNVSYSRTVTETAAYSSTSNIGINIANYFQFSYSYKFNKGKNVKKLNHNVEVESDSKSQAIGR
ncbi:MAG: TonB-dependent receptor [Bacteroidales bacterium]|jgi:outer membrane receptor protein involved in Fe transport